MKSFFLFLSLIVGTAQGQIFADFSTTLGDYTVELDYTNSPRTVANFIILAEGSRPWIDSTSGETKFNTPYYTGIQFHRVIDDFIIQAGSPNGQGTDGPGYNFPDETDNGITFEAPYLLAMANSGPNTNGSQFFITEGTPTFLNGIHTIFGTVTVGQAVIDLIHETPVNSSDRPLTDVVINSVTIRRVGAPAQAFDEFAEELPIVSTLDLDISADGSELLLSQPSGSTLQAYRSTDLLNWSPFSHLIDSTQSPGTNFTPPANPASPTQEFYRAALITWPVSAPAPESYRGRTLTFTIGATVIVVAINSAGAATEGSITFNSEGGLVTELLEEFTNPYGASLVVFSDTFAPFRFRLGNDNATGGRVTGTFFTSPSQDFSGTYTLTTP